MRYLPHTDQDIRQMLEAMGQGSLDELFDCIPETDRTTAPLGLDAPLCEMDVLDRLRELAAANRAPGDGGNLLSFLGAGAYPHTVPQALDQLLRRSEFLTAYTPYQPEISQGTLQAVFEFQTMVCELFDLEVANASLYDGATALAEALLMARRIKRCDRFVVSEAVHPEYLETCLTFTSGVPGAEIVRVGVGPDGRTDLAAAREALQSPAACLAVQSPNFFGVIEDWATLGAAAHDADALAVGVVTDPVSLGLLKPPGSFGYDIAVGEGLGYAVPISFGGPGVGLFATRDKYKRNAPGRLVGETVDADGVRGFVLTLATREQHIRRERATSNICTNQGLIALAFTIQSSLLSQSGMTRLARLNYAKATYARQQIAALPGFALRYSGPTFHEIAVTVPGGDASALVDDLRAEDIVPGVPLGRFNDTLRDTLLVCVTERHSRDDIDALVDALAKKGA